MLRYTYTADHRVKRIEAHIAGIWKDVINNAVYQPFGGPLIGFAHGNGWNRQIDYDLDGRVKKIYGAGTTHPQNLVYSYNANDLITGITNHKNVSATQTFGYDVMSALTSANASATGLHSWQHDANGNRTSHTWGGGTDTYAVAPGTNRLASLSGPRARSATHDPMGNLRTETRGGVTVERRYNGFNRQVKLIRPSAQSIAQPNGATLNLPAGTWDYGYNALGQRVSKAKVGGSTIRYLFSPGSLLFGETNADSSSLDTIYIWLERQPVGVIRGGQLHAVHTDHLGRPEVATNASKVVVWRANNLAFDRNVTTNTFGDLSLGFPGQQYDVEAGTWYNVFRDYDASIGRYTRSDPIGLLGGFNTYSYVHGNPLAYTDFFGLSAKDVATIRSIFDATVKKMTEQGLRHSSPTINNIQRYWGRRTGDIIGDSKKLDCGEQTEYMNEVLWNGEYDDKWTFYMDAGIGHAWGVAVSSNPDDPMIWYDTRANSFSEGSPCPSCVGWFGDSTQFPGE